MALINVIYDVIITSLQLPGAWTEIDGKKVTLYGSRFHDDRKAVQGQEVTIPGLPRPAVVNKEGMHIFGKDGKKVCGVCIVWCVCVLCVCVVCVCVCVCDGNDVLSW